MAEIRDTRNTGNTGNIGRNTGDAPEQTEEVIAAAGAAALELSQQDKEYAFKEEKHKSINSVNSVDNKMNKGGGEKQEKELKEQKEEYRKEHEKKQEEKNEEEAENPLPGEIAVSFLLTKEDYADYCVTGVNYRIPLREKMAIRLLGLAAVLCGFLFAWLFKGAWVFGWTACLELIGLVMLIWYDWILPVYLKASAYGYMDRHREELTARSFIFSASGFSYKGGGCRMELPYEMLYEALETSRMFILYMGAEDSVYLPKRAVSEKDCGEIRAYLKNALQEKMNQEGAR